MNKIAVIGGGAAGMMAAITAAEKGAKVTVFERNDRVGKKILVTGNGKCNLSNMELSGSCYASEYPQLYQKVLAQFPVWSAITFFEKAGLICKTKNQLVYPFSEQASAVLDVLRMELQSKGVQVLTERQVDTIRKGNGGFALQAGTEQYTFDKVIMACGSRAGIKENIKINGYQLAESMGHKVLAVLPALVQLRCREAYFKGLAGVRAEAGVTLLAGGKTVQADKGELQLTDYGISGIPVFQISGAASKALAAGKDVSVEIDFLPMMMDEHLTAFIKRRYEEHGQKTLEEFMVGVVHKKLAMTAIKQKGHKPGKIVNELEKSQLMELFYFFKKWNVTVEKTNSFEQAQICTGGVDCRELTGDMESRIVQGLYFAGEMVDVDGKCGGYNLQWAWSSGHVAGIAASREG